MSLDRAIAPDPYDLLPAVPSFTVTSTDVADGQPLDEIFAHPSAGGKNLSPQLSWSGLPGRDPRVRGHLLRPGRPDRQRLLALVAGQPAGLGHRTGARRRPAAEGAFCVRNDYGEANYGGAAPPPGDRPHRYVFAVHALDVDRLEVAEGATPAYVGFNLAFHTLARATIRPTFQVKG